MASITPTASLSRIPPELFRFTSGDRAQLYGAILAAFAEANERLETALALDDVRVRVGAGWYEALSDDDFCAALDQLRDWQLLDVTQNHAEQYRTALEYERRNLAYSLTRRGEAAIAGVAHALQVLTATGALQTAVLDAIVDRLAELDALAPDPAASNRRIFSALSELESHLEALRNNTKQFNGELQRLLRADGADLTTFHEVKAATVAYLQEFLGNLDQRAFAIAASIERIEERGIADLRGRALAGADLPALSGDDPGPEWLAHRRSRWAGLQAWFRPVDGTTPRVTQLHVVARRAIVSLLQVLDRITESRRRATSAVADFRELARWFNLAPSEPDLHRLWTTAFGLSSARHAHLSHADPDLYGAESRWAATPPVKVSAHLRRSGRTEHFGFTARVRDVAALKASRASQARAERAEMQAAWDLLASDDELNLSEFASLDHAVFERLLDLLGRALATPAGSDGVRRAVTGDGQVEIELHTPDGRRTAVLRTSRGTFSGPDYRVRISRSTAAPQQVRGPDVLREASA
ncbi:MAG: TIGR02677 family protein [Geodermatophilaceae bacterium]|nr:TIGR02677 family protein [Geodermatophilaceae bacterium]